MKYTLRKETHEHTLRLNSPEPRRWRWQKQSPLRKTVPATSNQPQIAKHAPTPDTKRQFYCWHMDKLPSVVKYHDDVKIHNQIRMSENSVSSPILKASWLRFSYIRKFTVTLTRKRRHSSVEITSLRRQGINSAVSHPPRTGMVWYNRV